MSVHKLPTKTPQPAQRIPVAKLLEEPKVIGFIAASRRVYAGQMRKEKV